MDIDMVMSFAFVLAILAFVATFVMKIINRNLEHKERMRTGLDRQGGASGEDYRKLEERVRVLERIATEGDGDLARQIEQLRDLQEIDLLPESKEMAR